MAQDKIQWPLPKDEAIPSPSVTAGKEIVPVGYGNPPLKTRFKPGHSGNPRGRPKGARNKMPALNEERLKSIVMTEAYRSIKINDGPRQIKVPMAQAIIRSLAVNAVKGQHRSQRLFSELLSATESSYKALHDEYLKTVLDYKSDWEEVLASYKVKGLPLPDLVPHPDDVDLDLRTGQIIIDGPMTYKQREKGRELIKRLLNSYQEVERFKQQQKKTRNENLRAIFETEIAHETKLQATMMDCINKTPWMQRELSAARSGGDNQARALNAVIE